MESPSQPARCLKQTVTISLLATVVCVVCGGAYKYAEWHHGSDARSLGRHSRGGLAHVPAHLDVVALPSAHLRHAEVEPMHEDNAIAVNAYSPLGGKGNDGLVTDVMPEDNAIAVNAYSPLGGKENDGQVTEILPEDHDLTVNAYSLLDPTENDGQVTAMLLEDPVLQQIADSYGKSIPQVIHQWLLQNGNTPMPKSSSQGRMRGSSDVLGFELSDADMKTIAIMDGLIRIDRSQFAIMEADQLA